jgi:rhomboid protease GluP
MTLNSGLLLVALLAALLAARLQFPPGRGRVPLLTLGVLVLLALALAAQIAVPGLLTLFERDGNAIARGDYYRLSTALWFQDGGLAGGAFNLTMLLVVGASAERLWNRWAWLLLYFGVGWSIECLALWWQPVGAGNSIAVCGLAGGLLAPSLIRPRLYGLWVIQAIGLGAAVALAWQHDIHGAAILLGAAAGLLLARQSWAGNQNPAQEFSAA